MKTKRMNPVGIITEDVTWSHSIGAHLMLDGGPHVLIAGTTGSGKSTMLNSVIYTIARKNADDLYLFDLKRVELRQWSKLQNCRLLCTEPEKVNMYLDHIIGLMESRYKSMRTPRWEGSKKYVIIDELADLVTIPGVLDKLVKIGRLGRAAEVRLICATQDPSRRTLPAALMQNFSSTFALRCRSSIESRQIIGKPGAEKLPLYGKGILWGAWGTYLFDVPLTPQEDIDKVICAFGKRPLIQEIYYIARYGGYWQTDPEYRRRIDEGLAFWCDHSPIEELCTPF